MAKAGSQIGLYTVMTVMGIVILVMIITSIIMYGASEKSSKELVDERAKIAEVYPVGVRGDRVVAFYQGNRKNQSLVKYLADSLSQTMVRAAGNDNMTYEQFVALLDGAESDDANASAGGLLEGDTTPLVDVIRNQRQRVESLRVQLDDSSAFLEDARQKLADKTAEINDLRDEQATELALLKGKIDQSVRDVEDYRASLTSTLELNNSRVEEIRRDAAEAQDSLNSRIAELEQEQLLMQSIVEELRTERAGSLVSAEDEYALADGRVLETRSNTNEIFINLGRDDRIVVGMTFEVYDSTTAIRPDAEGVYPLGKAALEVIRINQGSSTCRVIRSNNRNRIVEGDIIANALYDPDKVYRFVVYGNFDTNRDNLATSQESQNIIGIISDWGGLLEAELSGNTDFLVLGERPLLPPEPSADSPLPVIQNYIRQKRSVEEYDRLFRVASQTSIPVLNQNRLYTMTGLTGDR
jgi:hypothetical protein